MGGLLGALIIGIMMTMLRKPFAGTRHGQAREGYRHSDRYEKGITIIAGLITVSMWLFVLVMFFSSGGLAGLPLAIGAFALTVIIFWPRVSFNFTKALWMQGKVRPTFYFAGLIDPSWRRMKTGSTLAAALAWRKDRSEKDEKFVLDRILKVKDKLDGELLMAWGLMSLRNEDVNRWRCLMRLVNDFGPKGCGFRTRALAMEWLALDALERGDHKAFRRYAYAERSSFFFGEVRRPLGRGNPEAMVKPDQTSPWDPNIGYRSVKTTSSPLLRTLAARLDDGQQAIDADLSPNVREVLKRVQPFALAEQLPDGHGQRSSWEGAAHKLLGSERSDEDMHTLFDGADSWLAEHEIDADARMSILDRLDDLGGAGEAHAELDDDDIERLTEKIRLSSDALRRATTERAPIWSITLDFLELASSIAQLRDEAEEAYYGLWDVVDYCVSNAAADVHNSYGDEEEAAGMMFCWLVEEAVSMGDIEAIDRYITNCCG